MLENAKIDRARSMNKNTEAKLPPSSTGRALPHRREMVSATDAIVAASRGCRRCAASQAGHSGALVSKVACPVAMPCA